MEAAGGARACTGGLQGLCWGDWERDPGPGGQWCGKGSGLSLLGGAPGQNA